VLGRRNGRGERDPRSAERNLCHLPGERQIPRPLRFDARGQHLAQQSPQLRETAALTCQIGKHQPHPKLLRGYGLPGVRCCRRFFVVRAARTGSTRGGLRCLGRIQLCCAGRAARVVLTDFLRRLALFFGRLDDVTGRDDAVRVRPRDFFAVRVATTVVPAIRGRRATARIILARERPGTILGPQLDHWNSGNAAGERHHQQTGNDLPGTACRKTVETPGHQQKIAFAAGRVRCVVWESVLEIQHKTTADWRQFSRGRDRFCARVRAPDQVAKVPSSTRTLPSGNMSCTQFSNNNDSTCPSR
jgi:hypothetical protein